ncbi:hypothetical protein FOA52_002307 [Chlamydomonas sp. UWO 241]|nr:hypothetical protein FOA52_002307 [Chlamydomonas sp. UWO 241]
MLTPATDEGPTTGDNLRQVVAPSRTGRKPPERARSCPGDTPTASVAKAPSLVDVAEEHVALLATTRRVGQSAAATQEEFIAEIRQAKGPDQSGPLPPLDTLFVYRRPLHKAHTNASPILTLDVHQHDAMYALSGCSDVCSTMSRVTTTTRDAMTELFHIDKILFRTWFKNRRVTIKKKPREKEVKIKIERPASGAAPRKPRLDRATTEPNVSMCASSDLAAAASVKNHSAPLYHRGGYGDAPPVAAAPGMDLHDGYAHTAQRTHRQSSPGCPAASSAYRVQGSPTMAPPLLTPRHSSMSAVGSGAAGAAACEYRGSLDIGASPLAPPQQHVGSGAAGAAVVYRGSLDMGGGDGEMMRRPNPLAPASPRLARQALNNGLGPFTGGGGGGTGGGGAGTSNSGMRRSANGNASTDLSRPCTLPMKMTSLSPPPASRLCASLAAMHACHDAFPSDGSMSPRVESERRSTVTVRQTKLDMHAYGVGHSIASAQTHTHDANGSTRPVDNPFSGRTNMGSPTHASGDAHACIASNALGSDLEVGGGGGPGGGAYGSGGGGGDFARPPLLRVRTVRQGHMLLRTGERVFTSPCAVAAAANAGAAADARFEGGGETKVEAAAAASAASGTSWPLLLHSLAQQQQQPRSYKGLRLSACSGGDGDANPGANDADMSDMFTDAGAAPTLSMLAFGSYGRCSYGAVDPLRQGGASGSGRLNSDQFSGECVQEEGDALSEALMMSSLEFINTSAPLPHVPYAHGSACPASASAPLPYLHPPHYPHGGGAGGGHDSDDPASRGSSSHLPSLWGYDYSSAVALAYPPAATRLSLLGLSVQRAASSTNDGTMRHSALVTSGGLDMGMHARQSAHNSHNHADTPLSMELLEQLQVGFGTSCDAVGDMMTPGARAQPRGAKPHGRLDGAMTGRGALAVTADQG